MAQHDYVIDNSTGANVRADINSVLQAIASNNSGSSAPSTTYAFQLFANTTTSKLQIRNAANSAFVDLIGLDGSIALPDGSVSSPSLAFSDDLNTGIFSSAADTFNVATGGVERMELGATTIFNESGADVDFRIEGDTEPNLFYVDAGNERIGIHTATPSDLVHILDNGADATIRLESTNSGGDARIKMIANSSGKSEIMLGDNDDSDTGLILYNHSDNNLSFNTAATERMRLDDTGQLLIGHSGSSKLAGILAQVNIESVNSGNLTVKRNSANEFDATLSLGKTRATSIGGATIVQENDRLGTIGFFGSDGNDTGSDAAKIRAECDGTPGVDDMPGRLLLMTTADGANGAVERIRINKAGNVGIGTSSANARLHVVNSASGTDAIISNAGNDSRLHIIAGTNQKNSIIRFGDPDDDNRGAIDYDHNGDSLSFRIAGVADVLLFNSQGLAQFTSAVPNNNGFLMNNNSSTNPEGLYLRFGSAAPNTQSRHFIKCTDNVGDKATIDSNGNSRNLNNSYGGFSDISLKENIVDAGSQWNDIKNIKVRVFNFKTDSASDKRIGVVAQEIETVCPKLVDITYDKNEDGEYLETGIKSVKYSVLYMKAIKALQEAITKIEVLETKVAALEAA